MIDLRRGDPAAARHRLGRVARLSPDHFAAWRNLAAACQSLGRWDEAAPALAHAHALRPRDAETSFALAVALAVVGDIDGAVALYRELAETPALRARALARLGLLQPRAVSDDELSTLRTAGDAPGPEQAAVLFALGEVLDVRGEPDAAFGAFAAGNRVKRVALTADPATDPERVAAEHERAAVTARARLPPETLVRHVGGGDTTCEPIFIVGMPRSGSTLIEQILASHPRVMGLGETGILPRLLERSAIYDLAVPLDRTLLRRTGDAYLAAAGDRGWNGRGRFTDKTLENHLHLGAIAVMFPRAVILHAVRDPIDTGYSCWRQLFASGAETFYDLAEIGSAYVRYRRLMEHWRTALPGRIVDVSYEALVADPEAETRRLVAACGPAWDDRCLQFHKTRRPIATASAAQVRRPIFKTSQQRWRRHEADLRPLIEALGPYARLS